MAMDVQAKRRLLIASASSRIRPGPSAQDDIGLEEPERIRAVADDLDPLEHRKPILRPLQARATSGPMTASRTDCYSAKLDAGATRALKDEAERLESFVA